MSEAQVWVGCLGCYNGGDLIGEWFPAADAPTEVSEFNAKVTLGRAQRSHLGENHEELWVMDHEGFEGLIDGEFSPSEGVRIDAILDELGDEAAAYGAWRSLSRSTNDIGDEDDIQEFRDKYLGEWASQRAYAEDYLDGTEMVPENLQSYFNYDKFARDMFMDYSTVDAPSGIYVFAN
jgi:antirestriction protein